MADINFGILDTQMPGRIAAIPQQQQAQQAQNAMQFMQMQGLMNQNELAKSQIRTATRAEESQNLLGKAYAGLDFSGAGGAGAPAGQSPYAAMKSQVIKSLTANNRADLIPGQLEKLNEMEHKETVNKELLGKIEKQSRDAVDYALKQYQSQIFKVTDAASGESLVRAAYKDRLLGPILSKFVPEEQAVSDAVNSINKPGGLKKWMAASMGMSADKMVDMLKTTTKTTNLNDVIREQRVDFFGDPVGPAVDTPMGVSPNTTATIEATRKNHLENLAQQGWTFDTDRGIAVNARLGISRPISTLMSPVGGGFSTAPAVGGAPAPSIAASGGGVPGQRQAPAGQPVAGVLGPKPADVQKTEIELNKQYTSESKGFIETKLAIDKAKAALKDAATNPTAGLSAGTAFMKILDPQSVVRETELAMALKSSGWFDRVTNIANTLQSGKTILTPTQITNLNKTIDGLFEEVKAEQRIVDSGYARRAKSYGLDVGNIIIDRGQNKVGITEKTPTNVPPIQSFRPSPEGRP